MTVSVAVCAHPSRLAMAEKLSRRLDWCPVNVDAGAGIIANHDATLRLAADVKPKSDWVVAIEDDAVPTYGFLQQADQALSEAPGAVASLYFGYVGARRRDTNLMLHLRDPHWILCRGFTSAVCIAVFRPYLERFLQTAGTITGMTVDERYSATVRKTSADIWVPHSNPSLVEHLDSPTIGETNSGIERRAYAVGTREKWTGENQKLWRRIWGH